MFSKSLTGVVKRNFSGDFFRDLSVFQFYPTEFFGLVTPLIHCCFAYFHLLATQPYEFPYLQSTSTISTAVSHIFTCCLADQTYKSPGVVRRNLTFQM